MICRIIYSKENSGRYTLIDAARGIAVLCMIFYHTLWDLVKVFGVSINWFDGDVMFAFQRAIRWAFILISGFCFCLGKRQLKNAAVVLVCSVLITLATVIFTPKGKIIFGVLSLLGSAMLITVPLKKWLLKVNSYVGAALCLLCFWFTKNIESGTLKIIFLDVSLPKALYANYLTAFLGFPQPRFYSADYVPLLPWIFVFWLGVYIFGIFKRIGFLEKMSTFRVVPLEFIGRHSLIIYMAHQPIIYGILYIIFEYLVK